MKHIIFLFLLLTLPFTASAKTNYLTEHLIKFGPSDFYVDFWQDQSILNDLKVLRFTNLHALYIDGHGGHNGIMYTVTPHDTRVHRGEYQPFSIESIAKALGTNVPNIHNFYLGACNKTGQFQPWHVRHYFPNVTNIVYTRYGTACHDTFIQSITVSRRDIRYDIQCNEGAFCPAMVSELYTGKNLRPYARNVASREVLFPGLP